MEDCDGGVDAVVVLDSMAGFLIFKLGFGGKVYIQEHGKGFLCVTDGPTQSAAHRIVDCWILRWKLILSKRMYHNILTIGFKGMSISGLVAMGV